MSTAPANPGSPRRPSLWKYLLVFLQGMAWGFVPLMLAGFGLALYTVQDTLKQVKADLPDVRGRFEVPPSRVTRVYAGNGELLAEFYLENRIVLSQEEIPVLLKQAFLAIEDSRFYSHAGIDLLGIFRAAVKNLQAGGVVEGASTITMQLSRALFLVDEVYSPADDSGTRKYTRKFSRKIKEALLSRELETNYSKDAILARYLNEVYLGHGTYGVEAAAQYYFGKSAREVTVAEGALLAGLPKAPNNFSPLRNAGRCRSRRNSVLDRMAELGYITSAEAQLAMEAALPTEAHGRPEKVLHAPYFVEHVRRWLEEEFTTKRVHGGGLEVYTSLDLELQEAAEKALRKGLRALDKRQAFRGPVNAETNPATLYDTVLAEGNICLGTITGFDKKDLLVEVLGRDGTINPKNYEWAKLKPPFQPLKTGDPILVRIEKMPETGPLELYLTQEPKVEGALFSMNSHTGEILAWVGGYNFGRSKFDRVTQAHRQPGSCFKTIIYTAAMEHGFTPASVIYDIPIIQEMDPTEAMAQQIKDQDDLDRDDLMEKRVWKPANYEGVFHGAVTLRQALENSMNIISLNLLDKLGMTPALQMARRLGITSPLERDLSLALGTQVVTLREICRTYGVYPNMGKLVDSRPVLKVASRDHRVLFEDVPKVRQVLDERTAYIMVSMLRGVVEHGTAQRARWLSRPAAGKTGTTNDYKDAWFIGFSPSILTGVWVGYDQIQPLGRGEAGSRAALPIWVEYMETAMKKDPVNAFPVPEGISFAMIDPGSGKLADGGTRAIRETFKRGTEPVADEQALATGGKEVSLDELMLGGGAGAGTQGGSDGEDRAAQYDSD